MASIYKRKWTNAKGAVKEAYRVEYTTPDGKKATKQFHTKREAKLFVESLSELKSQYKQQSMDTTLFGEVCDAWLAAAEKGRGDHPPEKLTIAEYRGLLTNYIKPELGNLLLSDITQQRLKEFRDWALERKIEAKRTRRRTRGHEQYQTISRSTAKKIVGVVKQVIGYALSEGMITVDPRRDINIKAQSGRHLNRSSDKIEIHTQEEMRIILETAEKLTRSQHKGIANRWIRYYPLVMVLVYCGLRASEVRGLYRESVDLNERTIEVKQRVDKLGEMGPPKSARSYRTVPFPSLMVEPLKRLLDSHDHRLVFATRNGTPMQHKNLMEDVWFYVQEKAGVPIRNLHSARHFYASSLIDMNVPLKELSELLGHEDEAFTLKTYGHLMKRADDKERRARLADALVLTDAAA